MNESLISEFLILKRFDIVVPFLSLMYSGKHGFGFNACVNRRKFKKLNWPLECLNIDLTKSDRRS
jgi:hypothetical protein